MFPPKSTIAVERCRSSRRSITGSIVSLSVLTAGLVVALEASPQRAAAACPADLYPNGVVNGVDLAIVLRQWTGPETYATCPPYKATDLNQDCRVNGQDLSVVLGAWGACPTPSCAGGFADIVFQGQTWQYKIPSTDMDVFVTINGKLAVSDSGVINGSLDAVIAGAGSVHYAVTDNATVLSAGGTTMDLLIGSPFDPSEVMVDKEVVDVGTVLASFLNEIEGGSSLSSWSATSLMLLTIMALAGTDAVMCEACAEASPPPSLVPPPVIGWGCKLTAIAAGAAITAAAAAGCVALLAACVPGTAVTFGGLAVPCTVLIGLCAGGTFAGGAAAYEACLRLWGTTPPPGGGAAACVASQN